MHISSVFHFIINHTISEGERRIHCWSDPDQIYFSRSNCMCENSSGQHQIRRCRYTADRGFNWMYMCSQRAVGESSINWCGQWPLCSTVAISCTCAHCECFVQSCHLLQLWNLFLQCLCIGLIHFCEKMSEKTLSLKQQPISRSDELLVVYH